jgi:hypothetical protein
VAAGIDDLAKYQILRLIYQQPAVAGTATYYATCLGFHSVQLTATLLDELAASGALVKESAQGTDVRYRMADDEDVRRELVRLYDSTNNPTAEAGVLRVLSDRSLLKVRARATSGRHGNGNSRPATWPHAEHTKSGHGGVANVPLDDGDSATMH